MQYQLARAGEVVAAGAPIVTILDLTDVYMTIFLPAADAGKLSVGDEARIVLDPVPDYVVPAKVSFVAADAQFTPKTVETKDERAKLMFRIKLKIDPVDSSAVLYAGEDRRPRAWASFARNRTWNGRPTFRSSFRSRLRPRRPTPLRLRRPRPRRRAPDAKASRNENARRKMTGEPIARVKNVSHRYGATVVARGRQHRHSLAHHGRRDRAGRRRQVERCSG